MRWIVHPRHDGHLKYVADDTIMRNGNSLFQGTNVSESASCEWCGRYLWPTSGARRKDEELDERSAGGGGKQPSSCLLTATLVLPSPLLSFLSVKHIGSFAPSLANCSIVGRDLSGTPLGSAVSISTILSVGIPETLAASEATLYTDEWVKSRLGFVVFNWYTNSSTENEGFAGL